GVQSHSLRERWWWLQCLPTTAGHGKQSPYNSNSSSTNMPSNAPRIAGRHFLQIPGPTPVPDRILRAMDRPTIDHRGPEFQQLGQRALAEIKTIFKTNGHVLLYPASGTGT